MALPNWIDAPVYECLIETARLRRADSLLEIGAGRGPVAARLLAGRVYPPRIVLTEASDRLHAHLSARFARYKGIVEVLFVNRPPPLPLPSGTFQRFVSCFVLDIMDPNSRQAYLDEAYHLLEDGQLFCALTVTDGISPFSRLVMSCGKALASLSPWLVLGARYESVVPSLSDDRWYIEARETLVSGGCASELVVARKLPSAST